MDDDCVSKNLRVLPHDSSSGEQPAEQASRDTKKEKAKSRRVEDSKRDGSDLGGNAETADEQRKEKGRLHTRNRLVNMAMVMLARRFHLSINRVSGDAAD